MNLAEIVAPWAIPGPYCFTPLQGGYMNAVYRVQTPAETFVLRIYKDTSNLLRLQHEHAITRHLQEAGLPLALPAPRPTPSGEVLVRVPAEEGEVLAAVLPLLAGTHPNLTDPAQMYAAGEGLGVLAQALGRLPRSCVRPDVPCYRDLAHFHTQVADLEALPAELPLDEASVAHLARVLAELQRTVPAVYATLPQQAIHGDYVPGNVLMEQGRVTGVLDFEFSCWDARAMDLATALGGGPSALWETGRWEELEAFGQGYASKASLSSEEITALPLLMRLRRAVIFIHVVGRFRQAMESEAWLRTICRWLLWADDWLADHGAELVARAHGWWA